MLTVAAFYHFTRLPDPAALIAPLRATCDDAGATGMILIAGEGVNGTIAAPGEGVETVLAALRALPGCAGLAAKYSTAAERPFRKMKVRLKREIVTMGVDGVDPTEKTGAYVDPADWNDLIERDDVMLIDVRNDYEVAIGQFRGAIDPKTERFRDFPDWWRVNRHAFQGKKVATYCTGGIRCEKATAYLLENGAEQVYHLKGGILAYLEKTSAETSLWDGACFVFDERVGVAHGLAETDHTLCRACRRPVSSADREHPDFELGVACPACAAERSEEDRRRFRERQRQIELAASRGDSHLSRDR